MDSLKVSKIVSFMVILLLVSFTGGLWAQDYTIEEYNEYQKAVEEGASAIVEFVNKYPESSLTQEYAVPQFFSSLNQLLEQGEHEQVVELAQSFLEEVDSSHFQALYFAAWSAFQLQNHELAAEYAEKACQDVPGETSPQVEDALEMILAKSYTRLGDIDSLLKVGPEYCADQNPGECFDIYPTLMRATFERKQLDEAATYAEHTLEALEEVQRPESYDPGQWSEYLATERSDAHAILGKQAFERKNWVEAERHYSRSAELNPGNRTRKAEALYYVGMSRWNQEDIDPAMKAFARGSLLEGTPHSEPCRDQLEKLYKGTHNGSLAGIDEFLENVTSE